MLSGIWVWLVFVYFDLDVNLRIPELDLAGDKLLYVPSCVNLIAEFRL